MNRVRLFWEQVIVSVKEVNPDCEGDPANRWFEKDERLRPRVSLNLIKRLGQLSLLALALALLNAPASFATARTSTGSGDWNTAGTWSPSGVPVAADTITIRAGDAITVLATPADSVTSVTFDNTSTSAASLTVSAGATLTVTGGISLENAAGATITNATLAGAGAITCASVTVGGTIAPTDTSTSFLTSTISTLTISGNLSLVAADADGVFDPPPKKENNAVFDLDSGSVSVGGTVSLHADDTGDGNGADAVLRLNIGAQSGTLTLSGATPFTISGSGMQHSFEPNGTTATVVYSGASQTIRAGSTAYNNLTLSGSGVKTPSAGFTANGIVTINSGVTLDVVAFTLTISTGTVVVNGTLDFTDATGEAVATGGACTLTMGAAGLIRTIDDAGLGPTDVATNASLQTSGGSWTTTSLDTNGTVEYSRTSAQVVTDRNYNNLTISATGTKTWTLTAARTVNGNVTLSSDGLTMSGTFTVDVKGNWSNSGTFTKGTETFAFSGSAAQTIGGSSSTAFTNLTINNSAGVSLNTAGSVSGVLTLTTDLTATAILTQSGTSAGTGDVVGTVQRADVGASAVPFGNPNVQVSNGSGMTLNVALVKAAPPSFPTAVARIYNLTIGSGSVSGATLRFHYLNSELGMNTATSLDLYRATGSPSATWVDQGAPTTRVTGAEPNNYIEQTGIGAFSAWTLADGGQVPTDIAMVGYGARAGRDGKTLIQWETGREVNNLGFNIYREEDGQRIRINKSLIAGSGLMASPGTVMTAGRSYAWQTSAEQAKGATLWIEEIDLSGYTVWHGPIISQSSDASLSPREQSIADQTVTLSDMAAESTYNGVTRPVESLANTAQPKTGKLAGAMTLTGAIISPRPPINPLNPTVKISLKQEGWYRVTQPQLVAAGFSPSVNPNAIQMFADNKEIPISVITNNGVFDSTSAIEFYGQGIDTPSTDTHVYSLTIGSNGLRIPTAQAKGGLPPSNSFLYAVERRDRSTYLTGVHNGDAENFFGATVGSSPTDQAITLKNVDTTALGQATIEIGMQGFTNGSHSVMVSLNGNPLGTIEHTNQAQGVAQFQVPNRVLAEGQNMVTLTSQGAGLDLSLVDHIRVTYFHTYAADGNALKFSATANQVVTLTGFTGAGVKVFDVTNPLSITRVSAAVTAQKSSPASVVTVVVPGAGTRTLLALGGDQTRSALSVMPDKTSAWRSGANAADLVIITHGSQKDSYAPLQALRRSQGLKVALVDVEDIYDEFANGNKSPQAIKDFLAYARTNWKTAPRYVLLAGSASYDPKNYQGFGAYDLVPTKLIDTVVTETASDDWFADFNMDGIAEMAVGRLPTPTSEEAQTTVTKLAVYENSAPLNNALLVADGNLGFDFETANDSLAASLPGSITVQKIERGQVGTATARQQLFDGIAAGQKIVNYVGHGSPSIWRDNLLTAADALGLTNTGRYPVFIAMTCLNGEFQHPQLNPLASALMNSRQGGAIAMWASSGMTRPSGQTVMNQQFYTTLFQTSAQSKGKSTQATLTLGEITNNAKSAVSDADVRRTWILFGDPSMRVK